MKETYTPPAHIKAEQWKHDERWRLANRMHQRDYRARQKAEKEMRENQLCWSCGEMRDQVLEPAGAAPGRPPRKPLFAPHCEGKRDLLASPPGQRKAARL